jgi:hypothetical protein
MRKPRTYLGLHHLLLHSQHFYRRDLWANEDAYVEVWCESESIAGVLGEVTQEFDVPLMPGRGHSSHAFLHAAAGTISARFHDGKQVFLYYVGDYDPSGLDALRHAEERLHEYADDDVAFEFAHLAVTLDQIRALRLPTRPPKISDSRAKGFEGGCVEAEAIPPDEMRAIVRAAIEQHIDSERLARTLELEEQERRTLARLTDEYVEGDVE